MHDRRANPPRQEEAHELVDLVEVVLLGDVVFGAVGWFAELQFGGEGDVGAVEGDGPDGEDLGEGYVEDQVPLVEC